MSASCVSACRCSRFVGLILVLVLPWTVRAQTAVDARIAEFVPSADHNQVTDGTAMVSSYELQIFQAGTTQIVQTINLGKPAPQLDGKIRVEFVTLLPTPLPGGVDYQARVAAVGPGGSSASEASNTFTYSSPCTYAISPTSRSSPAAGESASVSITAGSGCAWTATSNASWLTVASGVSGSGNGTSGITVSQNTGTTSRTGAVTIAGHTFTVTQAAACTYSISPTSRSSPAAGEMVSVGVTTGSACPWAATSNVPWLSVGGATAVGSASRWITVAQNTGTASRTGTVTIAGRTFTVTQGPAGCSYAISPTSRSSPAAGEMVSVGVTTGNACTWTATSSVPWLSVGGATAVGSASRWITVAQNTGTTSRTGTVIIAGQTFTVTQGPAGCIYAISPTSRSSPAAGEMVSVSVTTGSACTWDAASNVPWLTVGGAPAVGSASRWITVAQNAGTTSRTGTVTIAGQTFSLTQAAAACTYAVNPIAISAPADGASRTISVTAGSGCAWTVTTVPTWMTVSSAPPSGSGSVSLVIAPNDKDQVRSATIVVAGQSVSVTQEEAKVLVAPSNLRVTEAKE
jgi:hypothetical protein